MEDDQAGDEPSDGFSKYFQRLFYGITSHFEAVNAKTTPKITLHVNQHNVANWSNSAGSTRT
jgi:hypothetical protein